MRNYFVLVLMLSSLLLGCNDSSLQTGNQETESSIATSKMKTPDTSVRNTEPFPSYKKSETPTPSITSTPLPTLSPEEITEYMRELLLTNKGCRLPCYLGITLGETTWNEVESFFEPFAFRISPPDLDMDPAGAEVNIRVDKYLHHLEFIHLRIVLKEDVVVEIQGETGSVQSYKLYEFLKTYGIPSEIHLATWMSGMSLPDYSFWYYLYYPDLGIMAIFWVSTIISEDLVTACPTDDLSPGLMLWEPEEEHTFLNLARFGRMFGSDREEKYFPQLEDATGMSVGEFYKTFTDLAAEDCFEVPRELFKYQWYDN